MRSHNNAAATKMHRDHDVVNVSTEVWDETMAINLRGPFFGCKYAIPEMLKRGGGSIVNTSSAAGLKAERIRVAYGVSKAALHGLTRHVANAYGKQNIRCNAIALGMILTEAAERNVKPEMLTYLQEHNHWRASAGRTTWPKWCPSSSRTRPRSSPAKSSPWTAGSRHTFRPWSITLGRLTHWAIERPGR